MSRLMVASVCSSSTVSRDDGSRLRVEIEKAWSQAEILVLDFSNLRIASVSFFDESLGLLARKYSLEELRKRIRIEHIGAADRTLLNKIVQMRASERETSTPPTSSPS